MAQENDYIVCPCPCRDYGLRNIQGRVVLVLKEAKQKLMSTAFGEDVQQIKMTVKELIEDTKKYNKRGWSLQNYTKKFTKVGWHLHQIKRRCIKPFAGIFKMVKRVLMPFANIFHKIIEVGIKPAAAIFNRLIRKL